MALLVQRRYDEIGRYQPGMMFLAVFTLLGTCFTFAPDGIGFFASVVPTLQNNAMWEAVGVLCIATSVKAIWNAHSLKRLAAPAGKE